MIEVDYRAFAESSGSRPSPRSRSRRSRATTWSSVHRTPSGTRDRPCWGSWRRSRLGHSRPFTRLRFPVQWVNRPTSTSEGSRGPSRPDGHIGEEVRVLPSGETATIKDIAFDENLDHAEAGQAVTITLDREVDIVRGDIIVSGDSPCEVSTSSRSTWSGWTRNTWAGPTSSRWGRTVNQVSDIKHRRDINSFEKLAASKLAAE